MDNQANEIKAKNNAQSKEIVSSNSKGIVKPELNLSFNDKLLNNFSDHLFANSDKQGFTAFSNFNNEDFFSKIGKDKQNINNDKTKNEDDDNKDDIFNSNPNSSKETNHNNFVQLIATQESKNLYDKLISKHIENLYIFNKEENKYISKGKGFISIETSKQQQKSSVIVFRNQMGFKIVEGYLNKKLSKFESYMKNYNNVASLTFIQVCQENKIEIQKIKIPFKFESDFKEFKQAFLLSLDYLDKDCNN